MSEAFVYGTDPRSIPEIARVEAGPGTVLTVEWVGGGGVSVDLAGWIALHNIEALRIPGIFSKPEIGEEGDTVQWAGHKELSIDSVHLELLAEQQASFGPAKLVAWQDRHRLSNIEAADLFAVHANTWSNYRTGASPVPRPVMIACRAIDRDPLPLAAFLRPRRPPPAAE